MLKSILLYAANISSIIFKDDRKVLINDVGRYIFKKDVFGKIPEFTAMEREKSLEEAIGWLLQAQQRMKDDGMGSYKLGANWSASYPETTGYIISTLIDYYLKSGRQEILDAAMKASRFLLNIQKDSGGWQGGRVNENRPEIVFNTAQVIRGLLSAYSIDKDPAFLKSIERGADWLCKVRHPEGFWQEHALMNRARVYDSFVDVPLLMTWKLSGKDKYREAAAGNLDWILNFKMQPNGWFEDCDNTVKRNDKPILHTIAYTLDGLIDSGLIMEEEKYIHAATLGADKLKDLFLQQGYLNGRYDRNWQGSEYFICTGGAQMASVWLKLFRLYGEPSYKLAAHKMIDLLIFIQRRSPDEKPDSRGAIPGSFPLWGRYEPFAFPNWATKFFCDALMLENEIEK